jgi:AcrR family transcriptional regulator
VPRLWTDTIHEHRREVRDAILDTAAALLSEHGLLSVTMSRIAERTGIGRATLYKYFHDVQEILHAWHEREIARHLEQLAAIRAQPGTASERLAAVLEAYALIRRDSRNHREAEVAEVLHRHEGVAKAEARLHRMIRDLVAEGANGGELRGDVPPEELATYCLHALAAAAGLRSKPAIQRLIGVTLAGLRPEGGRPAP